MALITDQPEGLPTTNALDNLEDPEAPEKVQPEELRLGSSTLMVLPNPPKTGEYIDVAMRLRIKRTAEDQPTPDSPLQWPRYAEIVVAWPLGEQMPEVKSKKAKEDDEINGVPVVDEHQPSLYSVPDKFGDEDDDEDQAEPEGEPEVDRPAFSHGEGGDDA